MTATATATATATWQRQSKTIIARSQIPILIDAMLALYLLPLSFNFIINQHTYVYFIKKVYEDPTIFVY